MNHHLITVLTEDSQVAGTCWGLLSIPSKVGEGEFPLEDTTGADCVGRDEWAGIWYSYHTADGPANSADSDTNEEGIVKIGIQWRRVMLE